MFNLKCLFQGCWLYFSNVDILLTVSLVLLYGLELCLVTENVSKAAIWVILGFAKVHEQCVRSDSKGEFRPQNLV